MLTTKESFNGAAGHTHTVMAGSPEYSTLILPQKQLPVGMVTGWSVANAIKGGLKFDVKSVASTLD